MGLFNTIATTFAQYAPDTFKGRILLFVELYTIWYIVYWTAQILYRLTFHPLAKYPGPFLCRIGYFYQMYYEAILNGKMLERLPMLHEKYGKSRFLRTLSHRFQSNCVLGPVVRINPHEVHIKDPIVFHE